MVLCDCFAPGFEPEEDGRYYYYYSKLRRHRRLVKTSGNALMEAPASSSDYAPSAATTVPTAPSAPPSDEDEDEDSSDRTVAVTVPPGVYPGDVIAVKSPDGMRTVHAKVPPGMTVGKTFMVEFPPLSLTSQASLQEMRSQPAFANALDEFMLAAPAEPVSPISTGKQQQQQQQPDVKTSHELLQAPGVGAFPPPIPPPFAQQQQLKPLNNNNKPRQKYLLVNVPPGTPAGATLHIEVPGENRTLAAQVPPGVTSFRVAYVPRDDGLEPNNNFIPARPYNPPGRLGQKLLLVQVPPGARPGATLHVAVPDEPGRILAAQVPPGDVKQFHVAYEPRATQQPSGQGFIPPTSHLKKPTDQSQRYNSQSNLLATRYSTTTNNNGRQNSHNGGGGQDGIGDYLLPAIGAAALGTAAYATYEHFS